MSIKYPVRKGWKIVFMSEEEIASDPDIQRVAKRDWVQDEDGVARYTIVGYEYVDVRKEEAPEELKKRLKFGLY